MKYLLTSAGITNPVLVRELEELLGKPLSETKVLFIPTAASKDAGDKSWLVRNLSDFYIQKCASFDILDVAAVESANWQARILNSDMICVGGGNEKYLSEVFDSIDMREFLLWLPANFVYMGISAGSMVVGNPLSSPQYEIIFSEEADFGDFTSPMMLLEDICIIPHLNSEYFQSIRKLVLDTIPDLPRNCYAIDDNTALSIDSRGIRIVGNGEHLVYTR